MKFRESETLELKKSTSQFMRKDYPGETVEKTRRIDSKKWSDGLRKTAYTVVHEGVSDGVNEGVKHGQ